MNLRLRCTSLSIEPSDASGFLIDVEVADGMTVLGQTLTREQILDLDEKAMRTLLGDAEFEKLAADGSRAAAHALESTPPHAEAGQDTGEEER